MAKLSTILDQIDAGSVLLPEFQRGYVWNRDQVRGLMKSLYSGYPVGALLVWETEGSAQAVRGGGMAANGALGAVRRLLAAPAVSDGFVTLWERQRLDLAVESLVVDER